MSVSLSHCSVSPQQGTQGGDIGECGVVGFEEGEVVLGTGLGVGMLIAEFGSRHSEMPFFPATLAKLLMLKQLNNGRCQYRVNA